jgi:hypothetical protein
MHQPGKESLDVVGETNQMDEKSHQIFIASSPQKSNKARCYW